MVFTKKNCDFNCGISKTHGNPGIIEINFNGGMVPGIMKFLKSLLVAWSYKKNSEMKHEILAA